MKKLYVSILECIYVLYMFLFFKTSIDFNVMRSPKGWLFEHLIGDEFGLRICMFGRIVIFFILPILIIRHFYPISKFVILGIIIVSFLFSLCNLNSLVYLLPVWLIELFYHNNFFEMILTQFS